MLPAEKQAARSDASTGAGTAQPLAAFGNVVKSVQGLEQRLEDLSVAEVKQAHATAHTMTVRLAELQRTLSTLTRIKEALAGSKAAVEAALAECVEAARLDAEDQRAASQCGAGPKLIIFPRPTRTAPASTEASPELRGSVPHAAAIAAVERAQQAEALARALADSGERNDFYDNEIGSFIPASEREIDAEADGPYRAAPTDVDFGPRSESGRTAAHDVQLEVPQPQDHPPGDVDQKVLDDLIEGYVSRKAARSVEGPETHPNTKQARDPHQKQQPAPEENAAQPRPRTEVDQQLKKIIQDYGKNDLYSHRSNINIKILVVAALVLIALAAFGFYYFTQSGAVPARAGTPSNVVERQSVGSRLLLYPEETAAAPAVSASNDRQ